MAEFRCSAVLFDLDGVLVDSIPIVERQWRIWAARHQLDENLVLRTAHGHRTLETVALLLPHSDTASEAEAVERAEIEDTDGLIRKPGAAELLAKMPAGRWGIVTSGTRELATTRLIAAGLPVPEKLVSADEVSNGKPHPEPYLKGASLLGVEPSTCVVFEDAPAGIQSAKGAGMKVMGVTGTYEAQNLLQADALVESLALVEVKLDHDAIVFRFPDKKRG